MKALSLTIIGILLASPIWGQTASYRFPGDHPFSKAKIYFKNNNRIEVSKLHIKDDHLTFINKATSQRGEYDLNEVHIIKVSTGTKAGEYALISGASFGATAAISLISVESDYYSDGPAAGPWIAGWTAGGLLIGAIVGATQEKWKTLYVDEKE